MKERLRRSWSEALGTTVEERVEEVSPDLPYELQSKMFDQLATVSLAGAGLSVTLIGTLVRNSTPMEWLPVLFFGTAAFIALTGNSNLIDALFTRRPALKQSRLYVVATILLASMGVGWLSMAVYHGAQPAAASSAEERK